MHILIWNSPFIGQGNMFFYKNAFLKTLIPQSNALCEAGHVVDIVITESTLDSIDFINKKINKIYIKNEDVLNMLGKIYDPNCKLYSDTNYMLNEIINILHGKLSSNYDIIIIWESPVPFLEEMYPGALIIHEMPSAFSRAPYPQLIMLDINGLFKKGSLYNEWKKISLYKSNSTVVNKFSIECHNIFSRLNIFYNELNISRKKFKKVHLLPLQVTAHYAFEVDSGYKSQIEFLFDVIQNIPSDEGIFVTQYTTRNVFDMPISEHLALFLNQKYPNIIYNPIFNKIENVSQYITPFVDSIISVSSSIPFHSMIWNKEINIFGDSYIKPFSDENLANHNIDITSAHTNILSFILEKHQVLYSNLEDKIFISNLLEELIHKKNTKSLDRYCKFQDIDKSYNENLFNGFRYNRSCKNLKKYFPNLIKTDEQIHKIINRIKSNEIIIISFDIFDTIISRTIEKPTDLFLFLEEFCFLKTSGKIRNFSFLRRNAEIESRKYCDSGETTLNDIYTYIEKNFCFPKEILNEIKNYELELELKFSSPHPFGQKIFQAAKDTEKRIILVTDIYLPNHFIESLLLKNGYSGYEKIYNSCELNLSKRNGDIYEYIINDLNINPQNIIHFGDNKKSDIENSEKNNINSYYICNAITRMMINNYYKKIFPPKSPTNKARTACVGLIAKKLFSTYTPDYERNSLFLGSPHLLGYAGLGPILISFVLWLIKKSREKGITKLYFLSREGKLIKEVYDIIAPHFNNYAQSIYLYASRRSLSVASIKDELDIVSIASLPYEDGCNIGSLLKNRFGIDYKHQLNTQSDKINYNSDDRNRFIQICLNNKDKIFKNAESERDAYIKYLKSMGCFDGNEISIVDIGWSARMQSKFHSILKKRIIGFYYATISGFEYPLTIGDEIYSFCSYGADINNKNIIIKNRKLFELFICCDELSLERMHIDNCIPIPKFANEDNFYQRKEFISLCHKGCINFTHDFVYYFSDFINTIIITPEFSTLIIEKFINNSSPLDVKLIEHINFIDNIASIQPKPGSTFVTVQSKTDINNKEKNKIIIKIEKFIFSKFLQQNKYIKYIKNRDIFFEDSKSRVMHWYYKKF